MGSDSFTLSPITVRARDNQFPETGKSRKGLKAATLERLGFFMQIKPHPDFPHYLVSDQGDVWNTGREGGNLRRVPMKLKVCLRGPSRAKYPGVTLCSKGKKHQKRIHVLVLETFVGPRPPGCQGAHGNGDRMDSKLTNLRWATQEENWTDRKKHGNDNCGEKNNLAKLTAENVIEIRKRRKDRCKQKTLAAEYGVSRQTIRHIERGLTWKHLPPAIPRAET